MQGLTIGLVYSYESLEQIQRCLQAIESQRHEIESLVHTMQIVLVATPKAAKVDLSFFRGILIRSETENLALNRNMALDQSQTEGFYFTDPDCWLAPDSLVQLVKKTIQASQDPSIYACAGANVLYSTDTRLNGFFLWLGHLRWLNGGLSQLVTNGKERFDWHAPTCHILYLKPRLSAPYFSEIFARAGEDLEFHFRQSRSSKKILITDQSFVWHEQAPSLMAYLRKVFFYGTSQTRLLKLHPSSWINRRLWMFFGILLSLILVLGLPKPLPSVFLASAGGCVVVILLAEAFLYKRGRPSLSFTFSWIFVALSYGLGQISGFFMPLKRIRR